MQKFIGIVAALIVSWFTVPALQSRIEGIKVESKTQTEVTTTDSKMTSEQPQKTLTDKDLQMADLQALISDLDVKLEKANELDEAIQLIISGILALLSYLIGEKLSNWLKNLFIKKRYKV